MPNASSNTRFLKRGFFGLAGIGVLLLGFEYANVQGMLVSRRAYMCPDSWELREEWHILGLKLQRGKEPLPLAGLKDTVDWEGEDEIWIYTLPVSLRKHRVIHGYGQGHIVKMQQLEQLQDHMSEDEVRSAFTGICGQLKNCRPSRNLAK